MRREYDHVVVGLGGIGSAAAYWLARRGARVLGLERFEIGHTNGASEDHSRIIRRSYHTTQYVRLAGEAYRAWHDVEDELGSPLLVLTGGIDLFPEGAAIPIDDYRESMREAGVPFEEMDGAEASKAKPRKLRVVAVRIAHPIALLAMTMIWVARLGRMWRVTSQLGVQPMLRAAVT